MEHMERERERQRELRLVCVMFFLGGGRGLCVWRKVKEREDKKMKTK